jgi:hypothetical protein
LEETSNNSDELNNSNKTNKTSKKKIQVYVQALTEIQNFYRCGSILYHRYNKPIKLLYLLKSDYTKCIYQLLNDSVIDYIVDNNMESIIQNLKEYLYSHHFLLLKKK